MGVTIRLVEPDSNRRGDLFTRRMEDVLHALGYEQFVRDFARPGREIDITGVHRTEGHRVAVECKATRQPIGGADLNKFAGVLDLERRQYPGVKTIGYFISLSGFTRSALDQEAAVGGGRLVAMDAPKAVRELINGRMVVSEELATERAGRCAAGHSGSLRLEPDRELLISQLGWIWVVYFASGKQRTSFALVHADGEPLAAKPAAEIIAADQAVGGSLHTLTWLAPLAEPAAEPDARLDEAKAAYLSYLQRDYGSITLEGLPPDQEIGVRQLKLENIFVPLHLEPLQDTSMPARRAGDERPPTPVVQRQPVGEVLSTHPRLAILATPGAGKSTLVKRLAVAYGFPERRSDADDHLPERPWLPLVIRCRQLGETATLPITEILQRIPVQAELPDLAPAFRQLIFRSLRSGSILLLVDGLDEIADEGRRVAFVLQLRTFLATYPAASVIVTSREAGFRVVGSALADVCQHYRIADFDKEDVRRLTVAWYREVVSTDEGARAEAEALAATIIDTDRVLQLARNPLLLTTLLLVKRWVGELPRRRSVLYDEAIKVLLRTWNVEGHKPIELDEAKPQLAFVAYAMLDAGTQRISLDDLTELLKQARSQMQDLLGFAQTSVADFVTRIELRSSLLSMSGYGVEGGRLVPVYEFRHLTFQEYLAALAIVEGYYPDRDEHDTLTDLLRPRFAQDAWKEVVPLAAVLAGRKAAPLVEALIQAVKDKSSEKDEERERNEKLAATLLAECLVDEVKLAPPLANRALELVAGFSGYDMPQEFRFVSQLLGGQYAASFREAVKREFAQASDTIDDISLRVALIGLYDLYGPIDLDLAAVVKPGPDRAKEVCNLLVGELAGGDEFRQAEVVFTIVLLTVSIRPKEEPEWAPEVSPALAGFAEHVVPLLRSGWDPLRYAASIAVDVLVDANSWDLEQTHSALGPLFAIWHDSDIAEVQNVAAKALADLPLVDRAARPLGPPTPEFADFLRAQLGPTDTDSSASTARKASLIAAYYLGSPWSDEELAEVIASTREDTFSWQADLLRALGETGQARLAELEQSRLVTPDHMEARVGSPPP